TYPVSVMDLTDRVKPLIVDVRAVVAPEILEEVDAPATHEYRVNPGDLGVVQNDVVLIAAPNGVLVRSEGDSFPRKGSMDKYQDRRGHLAQIIAAASPLVNEPTDTPRI